MNSSCAVLLNGIRLGFAKVVTILVVFGWFRFSPRWFGWAPYWAAELVFFIGATALLIGALLFLINLWLSVGRRLAIAKRGRIGLAGVIAIGTLPNVIMTVYMWNTESTDYLAPYLTATVILAFDALLMTIVVAAAYIGERTRAS